jgi:uroporphyrinogen decarboxylase
MQISPELWRRFIKPAWHDVLGAVRAAVPGARFFLHSCGNIRAVVPDIVDVGFNVLHPIQPECMDVAEVYREFGRQIVPCTTISAQRVFPFGTPDEVRAEVRRLLGLTAKDRRGFLVPSNRVQPETPWENILAFVSESTPHAPREENKPTTGASRRA